MTPKSAQELYEERVEAELEVVPDYTDGTGLSVKERHVYKYGFKHALEWAKANPPPETLNVLAEANEIIRTTSQKDGTYLLPPHRIDRWFKALADFERGMG